MVTLAAPSENMYSNTCTDLDSYRACAKSHSGICSPLIHSVVSNYSVSGEPRPWSDCADAHADQGLCCPHGPEDKFLHEEVHK